jgi:hypothetical protein
LERLAFIALNEVEKGVFRGGALVTDMRGKPLEFRCTSAIQPTAVQKTLYGDTLRGHMCVELTARPLLSALNETPQAVLVTQRDFMDLRKFVDSPLLLVAKQGQALAEKESDGSQARSELLASPSGRFEPVTVTCHWQHPEDTAATREDLGNLFSRFDLTEPFARIANALALLHEKNVVPDK